MIWAVLAILGVPLWVIAGGIAYMFLLNRRLRNRAGDLPVRVRHASGKRWRRGHGLWVDHVFAWRSSPSGWAESLDLIRSADVREPSAGKTEGLRRMKDPVIVVLTGDARAFEVACPAGMLAAALGPFHEAGRPAPEDQA